MLSSVGFRIERPAVVGRYRKAPRFPVRSMGRHCRANPWSRHASTGIHGKKARRLVIYAEGIAIPPWGGWTYLSSDESKRRTFTQFRRAVNAALAPHQVDHIEFITKQAARSISDNFRQ